MIPIRRTIHAIDMTELGTYRATTGADGRAQTTLILRERRRRHLPNLSVASPMMAPSLRIFVVTVDICTATEVNGHNNNDRSAAGADDPRERSQAIIRQGVPGTVLTDPFVVEVRDQDGEPLEQEFLSHLRSPSGAGGAMGVVSLKDRFRWTGGECHDPLEPCPVVNKSTGSVLKALTRER